VDLEISTAAAALFGFLFFGFGWYRPRLGEARLRR
jgi:hypothetical protein